MNITFTCKAITSTAIIVDCHYDWSQDDLTSMVERYFQQYVILQKVEYSQGADLASVRFKWQQHDFTLNFECYSQSIWIECPEHDSAALLAKLYQLMNLK
ncbi:DUF3630 family protein [Thalassotalea sp. SU-HH00458]|uniref:DUF3630 family protein n=1 Tax=Thalassotalea sp. SU-HH00458 TaxID=3127657 RepID=UPI003102DD0A